METTEVKIRSIAGFMGIKVPFKHGDEIENSAVENGDELFYIHELEYHSSWESLMPVIKKCKSISLQSEELTFDNGKPTTNLHIQELYEEIEDGLLELDIDLTFEAVVNFIEYFRKID